ncbi:MAG: family 16 glycosylhydrolase [Candidatus Margulisbacteria bacterium]|nr:family 16 glycosylhydrolase [Candidatus Margulisiibacteriota bacterium]
MSLLDTIRTTMVEFYTGSAPVGLTGCNRSYNNVQSNVPSITSETTSPLPDALITWPPSLSQELVAHDDANWQKANWSNGQPFNVSWQPDNIIFRDGLMILQLDNEGCPADCDGLPYASGEYRTIQEDFGQGYYEARIMGSSGEGLNTSFFIYSGDSGSESHDEIDVVEILGRNCEQVQTNYYVEGRGKHELMINLDFNACEEFHNYGLAWSEDTLIWYIDGREVRRVAEDLSTEAHELPYRPGKITVNFWAGIGVEAWLGNFAYPGHPMEAQYDWLRFSSPSETAR